MAKINMINKLIIFSIFSFLISQPVMAAKFKCWTNKEGVKECGSYVPAEYSQKRIETRSDTGRVVEVKERAKNKTELAEVERQKKLKQIEDEKIAEQNKKDSILLKTFTNERDINMLRNSKVNVIEGIITVIKSNTKAQKKKLENLHKKAANIERGGKKPPQTVLDDITNIEAHLKSNKDSIKSKRAEQKMIRDKFAKDLERFHTLKGKTVPNATKN